VVFGQQEQPADQQHRHHRHVDQEHRTPPEVFEQNATHEGSQCRASRKRRRPHADGQAAFPRVGEDAADQRQGGGRERRPRDAEQGAGADEHLGRGCVGGQGGHGRETRCAGEQELAVTDPVAEAAHGDQQAGQDEGVDVADPEQLGARGAEVAADERRGKGQHRAVDADQQDAESENAKGEPAAGHEESAPFNSSSVIMWSKSRSATRPTWMTQPAPATRL
jgi:hypothetical protein